MREPFTENQLQAIGAQNVRGEKYFTKAETETEKWFLHELLSLGHPRLHGSPRQARLVPPAYVEMHQV